MFFRGHPAAAQGIWLIDKVHFNLNGYLTCRYRYMSDRQYSRNNGDIDVGHGTVQSVFRKDTSTLILPHPQRTTTNVLPSKCSTGCYQ